jgi:putative aldouronate transport system substrate-binding protein
MKKVLCVMMSILIVLAMTLTGCKSKSETTDNSSPAVTESAKAEVTVAPVGPDNSEEVTLTYYYAGDPQVDVSKVEEAMSNILKEKINAKIKLVAIPFGEYDNKLKLMVNSGEEFDLCFTSSWMFDYLSNSTNGAFVDLSELLPLYAPGLWSSLKTEWWDAAKVNGKIYASINQQIFAQQSGFWFNKEYIDKYDPDFASINTFTKFKDYMINVISNEPKEKTTFMTWSADWVTNMKYANSWENVGGSNAPGCIIATDAKPVVFNEYDTPEYKEVIECGKEMQDAGVIRKDILTAATYDRSQMFGAASFIQPGIEAIIKNDYIQNEVAVSTIGSPLITTNNLTATMTAVSSTSKNPERAVQFLELINTDIELYNLLCHGIEGVHYTLDADGYYTTVTNTQYNPSEDWMFGCVYNSIPAAGTDPEKNAKTQELNNSAVTSVLMGFVFNDEKVKTEEANCAAVITEYMPVFAAGLYGDDTDAKYTKFLQALKDAGVDTLIAEKQAQVDAFLANK